MIAIIDYGMGNLRSLMNAFAFISESAVITADPAVFDTADRMVLPGVGAFGDAMKAIRALGLEQPLNHQALEVRKPILGICLGMQLFAKSSQEHGFHTGLNWLDADVRPLKVEPPAKVPHVGWNATCFAEGDWLFEGVPTKESDFYFVHSHHMVCHNPADLAATIDHSGQVTAAVRRDNLVATQFHPEKSQDNGLRLLRNWMNRDFSC